MKALLQSPTKSSLVEPRYTAVQLENGKRLLIEKYLVIAGAIKKWQKKAPSLFMKTIGLYYYISIRLVKRL